VFHQDDMPIEPVHRKIQDQSKKSQPNLTFRDQGTDHECLNDIKSQLCLTSDSTLHPFIDKNCFQFAGQELQPIQITQPTQPYGRKDLLFHSSKPITTDLNLCRAVTPTKHCSTINVYILPVRIVSRGIGLLLHDVFQRYEST
jgi:hypothetical protein